jgi:hypothetical protein
MGTYDLTSPFELRVCHGRHLRGPRVCQSTQIAVAQFGRTVIGTSAYPFSARIEVTADPRMIDPERDP